MYLDMEDTYTKYKEEYLNFMQLNIFENIGIIYGLFIYNIFYVALSEFIGNKVWICYW